ncbi:Agglutinin-like protein 1, partial [Meyerozyma sp. JA9]
MIFWFFAAFLTLALQVHAAALNGVFTGIKSIVATGTALSFSWPQSPSWQATVSWMLDGGAVNAGDTFTLNMPHVFKFTSDTNTISLTANGITYATCTMFSGEFIVDYSELQCTVASGLTANNIAIGTINFPITFDPGFSSANPAIEGANFWVAGTNTVSWTSGSNTITGSVTFAAGALSTTPDLNNYGAKLAPSTNQIQWFFMGTSCSSSAQSGTLGISFDSSGPTLQCGTLTAAITNSVNDWSFPMNAKSFTYSVQCSSSSVLITYSGVPAGYRPYLNIYSPYLPTGQNVATYTENYRCGSGFTNPLTYQYNWIAYANGNTGGSGSNFVNTIVTRTYTGSTTAITTLPYSSTVSGATRTIRVDVPVPTVTTTKTWTGSGTTTKTATATPGQTGTVEIDLPVPTTTVTSTWTGVGST